MRLGGEMPLVDLHPRYFTDGVQKVISLTGSHTWANLQDMATVDPPAIFDSEPDVGTGRKLSVSNFQNYPQRFMWSSSIQ